MTKPVQLNLDHLQQIIEDLLNFPNALICRHWVIMTLIDALLKNGVRVPYSLLDAVVKSSEGDEEALRILAEWRNE